MSEHWLQTRNERQRVERGMRVEDEDPTFEGDEDAGCCQRVIDHRVPQGEAGQCQEGVERPQIVQLHGRLTSRRTQ